MPQPAVEEDGGDQPPHLAVGDPVAVVAGGLGQPRDAEVLGEDLGEEHDAGDHHEPDGGPLPAPGLEHPAAAVAVVVPVVNPHTRPPHRPAVRRLC